MRKTQSFLRVSLALLALWGILFAGCSSGSDDDGSPPPALAEPISGVQVYSYPGGADYTPSGEATFQYFRGGDPGITALATAGLSNIVVNTEGKLSFDLENETPADSALEEAEGMKILILGYFSQVSTPRPDTKLGLLKLVPGHQPLFARLWYSDKNQIFAQTMEDDQGNSMNLNLNLVKGWNWVIEKRRDTNYSTESLTSQRPDSSFKWYIGDFPD
jgi:hypothetical protein